MKFVSEGNIQLPESLYWSCEEPESTSPAARFDPPSAANGNAWKNSTAPSKQPRKRILILTENSFKAALFDYGKTLALIARLQNAGFRILFKNIIGDFTEISKDLTNLTPDFLSILDSKTKSSDDADYRRLAKQNIAREQTIFLNAEHVFEIEDYLKQQTTGACYLQGNGIELTYNLLPDLLDIDNLQKLSPERIPLVLKYTAPLQSASQLKDIIKAATAQTPQDCFTIIQIIISAIESGNTSIVEELIKEQPETITNIINKQVLNQIPIAEIRNLTHDFNKLLKCAEKHGTTVITEFLVKIIKDLNPEINNLLRKNQEITIFSETKYETEAIKKIKARIESLTSDYSSYHEEFQDDIDDIIFEQYEPSKELFELFSIYYNFIKEKLRENPESILKNFIFKIIRSYPEYGKNLFAEFLQDPKHIKIVSSKYMYMPRHKYEFDMIHLLHELNRGDIVEEAIRTYKYSDPELFRDLNNGLARFTENVSTNDNKPLENYIRNIDELLECIKCKLLQQADPQQIVAIIKNNNNKLFTFDNTGLQQITGIDNKFYELLNILNKAGAEYAELIPQILDLVQCELKKLSTTDSTKNHEINIDPLKIALELGVHNLPETTLDLIFRLNYSLANYQKSISSKNFKLHSGIDIFISRLLRHIDSQDLSKNLENYAFALRHFPETIRRIIFSKSSASCQNFVLTASEYIEQNPTALHIIDLSSKSQLAELKKSQAELKHIVALDIIAAPDPLLLLELLSYLPNLKYLKLPKIIKEEFNKILAENEQQLLRTSLYVEYVDPIQYVKAVTHKAGSHNSDGFISDISLFGNRALPNETAADSETKDATELTISATASPTEQKETGTAVKKTNWIKIAIGQSNENGLADTGPSTGFNMVIAGEVLNCDIEAEIRTNIITYKDITKFTEKREYTAQTFKEIPQDKYKILTAEDIEKYRNYDAKKNIYYRFEQNLPKGEWRRLLSAAATEKLVGILTNPAGVKVSLKKGDDDFIYAYSDKDITLTNVTEVAAVDYYSFVSKDHPVKRIISQYLNSTPNPEAKLADYDPKEHAEWLENIFSNNNLGACRHKLAAVYYKLLTSSVKKQDIRIVQINGNHVKIEMRYNNKWFFAADLGGINSEERIVTGTYIAPKIESAETKVETVETKTQIAPPPTTTSTFFQDRLRPKSQNITLKMLTSGNLPSIIKPLLAKKEPPVINDAELVKLVSTNDNNKHHRILLTTGDDLDNVANRLLQIATQQQRPVYYIDNIKKINLNTKTVTIRAYGNITQNQLLRHDRYSINIEDHGALYDFLKKANEAGAILIINWSNLSAKEHVKLNTLLDNNPTINGHNLAKTTQIFSLSRQELTDKSFLSRHHLKAKTSGIKPEQVETPIINTEKIDLRGLANWRAALFGSINLVNNEIIWQQSQLTKDLLKGEILNFELCNLSEDAKKEFAYEYAQGKATGQFIYHGFAIPITADVNIICSQQEFAFEKFIPTLHYSEAILEQTPPGTKIINSLLFDELLHGKQVANGIYSQTDGLIKTHSGGELTLFITQELSISQYYCLLANAQQHQTKLIIYTAKNVKLPATLKVNTTIIEQLPTKKLAINSGGLQAPPAARQQNNCRIYVSNNPNLTIKETITKQHGPAYAAISIEDYTYQDLITAIDFKITGNKFCDFSVKTSELISLLSASQDNATTESKDPLNNQKIILKGEFSNELLTLLQPIIAGIPPYAEISKKLIFLIEDCNLPNQKNDYQPLQWLNNSQYKIDRQIPPVTKAAKKIVEAIANPEVLDDNSKEAADNFIANRKKLLLGELETNSMVQLVGHSGVGKSRLMKILHAENQDICNIYTELDNFEKWANDPHPTKTKILFIDEANIEDQHLTMFEPLKNHDANNDNRRIFYKGKFYNLSPQHKVVFARNPLEYGGARIEQKLFKDGSIPEIHFKDFPACYIYEKILKEAIYDKLEIHLKKRFTDFNIFNEQQFKQEALKFIKQYLDTNKYNQEKVTVRELQEWMLITLYDKLKETMDKLLDYMRAQEYDRTFHSADFGLFFSRHSLGTNIDDSNVYNDEFSATEATKPTIQALRKAIGIRNIQRLYIAPHDAAGLNAVLIEGDAGIGKSSMIKALLKRMEIEPALLEEETEIKEAKTFSTSNNKSRPLYYKIDAGLSEDEKIKLIIKAFDEGNIVWLDELNSCSNMLEKTLNSVLTGVHPVTGEKAKVPGFMLISSINQISEIGRSAISPALTHRSYCIKAKSLHEYSVEDLTAILRRWYFKTIDNTEKSVSKGLSDRVIGTTYSTLIKYIPCAAQASEIYQALQNPDNHHLFTLRELDQKAKDLYCELYMNILEAAKASKQAQRA